MENQKLKAQIGKKLSEYLELINLFIEGKIGDLALERLIKKDEIGNILWNYLTNSYDKDTSAELLELLEEVDRVLGIKKVIFLEKFEKYRWPLNLKGISSVSSEDKVIYTLRNARDDVFTFAMDKKNIPSIINFFFETFSKGNIVLTEEQLEMVVKELEKAEETAKHIRKKIQEVYKNENIQRTEKDL